MSNPDAPTTSPHPSPVTLRPEQPGDEPFLFQVYASTRTEELDATGWDAATRQTFLELQFKAMRQSYRSAFPQAESLVILQGGQPVGRMVVHRTKTEIRLVDLALLPVQRERGIGTALLKDLCAESIRTRIPVRLQVFLDNRARRLYERLGFVRLGVEGCYEQMEWRPPAKRGQESAG